MNQRIRVTTTFKMLAMYETTANSHFLTMSRVRKQWQCIASWNFFLCFAQIDQRYEPLCTAFGSGHTTQKGCTNPDNKVWEVSPHFMSCVTLASFPGLPVSGLGTRLVSYLLVFHGCLYLQAVRIAGKVHTSNTTWESPFLPSAGVIIGVVLRYAISPQGQPEYYLATKDDNCSERAEFVTGESIELISFTGDDGTEERFLCSVVGKVFENSRGNYIQQTVCARTCRLWISNLNTSLVHI